MELTIEELADIVKNVVESIKEEGEKGRDGYVDETAKPNGFSNVAALDFSQTSEEGNFYKKQGASNMGPWTSESVLRKVIRNMVRESFELKHMPNSKSKQSAPFNTRANVGEQGSVGNIKMSEWKSTKNGKVWEQLAHWYDVKENKSTKKKKDPKVDSRMVKQMETAGFWSQVNKKG